MRNVIASVAAALCIATAAALPACVNTPAVQSLKPRDARAAYAEAEIFFVGVINATEVLAAHGFLSNAQIGEFIAAYQRIGATLDEAYALLKAGEAVVALAKVDATLSELRRIAFALETIKEAAAKTPPPPPGPSA